MDCRKRQTATATPAKPGSVPLTLEAIGPSAMMPAARRGLQLRSNRSVIRAICGQPFGRVLLIKSGAGRFALHEQPTTTLPLCNCCRIGSFNVIDEIRR